MNIGLMSVSRLWLQPTKDRGYGTGNSRQGTGERGHKGQGTRSRKREKGKIGKLEKGKKGKLEKGKKGTEDRGQGTGNRGRTLDTYRLYK